MTVFAWVLFVISALSILTYLWEWFARGEGLLTLLQSLGMGTYCVLYLFVFSPPAMVTWIYFGVYCGFAFLSLIMRKLYATVYATTCGIFFALILFL